MAAAFVAAGFEATDVAMQDLKTDRRTMNLQDFKGVAFCGGFSYGDALGAGAGWATVIMQDNRLRDLFAEFFARTDTFTLGVCNGCQVLARISELIPDANWDCHFLPNRSQRYEARTVMTRICNSPSIFHRDMAGSLLPIVAAHAEGRTAFGKKETAKRMERENKVAMVYADDTGRATMAYPLNPNGAENAIAALTSESGRVTIMMPHPVRIFRGITQTWKHPADSAEATGIQPLAGNVFPTHATGLIKKTPFAFSLNEISYNPQRILSVFRFAGGYGSFFSLS